MKLGKSQREKEPKRVASVACFSPDGLLLFGLRNDSGKWTLPGGHLEPGEAPMEGARRELLEETGLEGKNFQYLGQGVGGRGSVVVHAYTCEADGDPTSKDDPDEECDEFRWVEPDEIPSEISDNLHDAKNVTLRLLGLQDGEVEEPMEKAEPYFVETNPWRGEPIRIPKAGTKARKQYDKEFKTNIAENFAGGDLTRLKPVRVPLTEHLGSNMAVNQSRLKLYKRMLKAGDKLPPAVVKRMGEGFHLLDGNHRAEAARHAGLPYIDAFEVLDAPLGKSEEELKKASKLKGALFGAGLLAAPMAHAPEHKPTPHIAQAPKPPQAPQVVAPPKWTPEGLSAELHPIAQLESSFGLNMEHAPHSKGEYHTAFGAVGFKPISAHEEYKKSKYLQSKYPGLDDPAEFTKHFKQDPKFYNLLASAFFKRLMHRHQTPEAAAYAWRWGSGAAASAAPEDIQNDSYVQKYKHMLLHQQQMGQALATMAKAEELEKGQQGNWQAEGYEIRHSIDDPHQPERLTVTAHAPDGSRVGMLDVSPSHSRPGTLYPTGIQVHPQHQRKGLATAMYQRAEQVLGLPMAPGSYQSPEAQMLWNQPSRPFGKSEVSDPISAMLDHDDPHERILALKHARVTPYHLRRALYDEDPDVRAFAAKHPKLTHVLLEEALRHKDLHTREQALSRPDLQDHHLEHVLFDPDLQVQVARHPALTEDQRQRLMEHHTTPKGLQQELLHKGVQQRLMPFNPKDPAQRLKPEEETKLGRWQGAHREPEDRIIAEMMAPEQSIGTILKQYGRLGTTDPKSIHFSRNPYYEEHEVLVRPNHNSFKATPEEVEQISKPTTTLHGRINTPVKPKYGSGPKQEALKERLQAVHRPTKKFEEELPEWLEFQKDHEDTSYNVYEDMLGMSPREEAYLKAVKFLASQEPDVDLFRQRMVDDADMEEAALNSVGLEADENNRKALLAVLEINDHSLGKSLLDNVHEVEALMPDGGEVADGIRRGFGADTEKPLQLSGKHSKGAMAVRDPKTQQTYLIKPGSGKQSPARGARQEAASQSRREAAFWHVANHWGLGSRLPRADLLLLDGKEVACLHLLPANWKNLEKLKRRDGAMPFKVLDKYRQTGELHRWAVLDFILGNPDRHGQNLMVGPAKDNFHVALIDHGSAFAGSDFDPASDPNSFIPYYLRAWQASSWKELDAEGRLKAMPMISRNLDDELKEWVNRLHADDLEQILTRYGIDPKPSVERLAKVKSLLTADNMSAAVNRLWLKT